MIRINRIAATQLDSLSDYRGPQDMVRFCRDPDHREALPGGRERGFIDAAEVTLESLLCIKRAGVDMIITNSALDAIAALTHRMSTPGL
jgi:hypothetical protein